MNINLRIQSILEHMLEDAQDAIDFTNTADSYEKLFENKLYRKAVVMSILNLGELTKQLPLEYKRTHNNIPWKKIAGMRDIAAHGYHEMDDDIIWDVIKNYLPGLIIFLQDQLNQDPNNLTLSE